MVQFAKGRRHNILYSPITIFILVVVCVFIAHSAWGVYLKEADSSAASAKTLNDLTVLREQQQKLQTENVQLETERGIESEIRQKYSVAKPNEEVYVIVDSKVATNTPNVGSGWWQDIKALFSH